MLDRIILRFHFEKKEEKTAMELQLQDGRKIRIDGEKVAEVIKASVEKANHDNTQGV